MKQGYRWFFASSRNLQKYGLWWLCFQALSSSLWGSLMMETVQQVYGEPHEIIHEIPGRPWVEVQHRYDDSQVWISCNYVGQHCLWIDYGFKSAPADETRVFAELERILPGMQWTPVAQPGKIRRWLNESEDRVTLRAGGFTLHTNEYIRNVLSRRAQWQF